MADRKFYSPTPSCPLIELGPTIILHNGTEAATSYLSQKPPRHPINKHVDNVVKVATPQVPPPRLFLLFIGTVSPRRGSPPAPLSVRLKAKPAMCTLVGWWHAVTEASFDSGAYGERVYVLSGGEARDQRIGTHRPWPSRTYRVLPSVRCRRRRRMHRNSDARSRFRVRTGLFNFFPRWRRVCRFFSAGCCYQGRVWWPTASIEALLVIVGDDMGFFYNSSTTELDAAGVPYMGREFDGIDFVWRISFASAELE